MIRKDYIPRYFDELAKVLAAVLELKSNQKLIEAEEKLNGFSTDYLGISFKKILSIESKNLITHLIKHKQFTLTHFKLLEDLLYHNFLLNSSDDNLKKITLEVLNYTAKIDTDYSVERMERIKQILN